MTILVTGAAGFIASKTCELLLKAGHRVVGVDNLNDYYDVRLKKHRLKALLSHKRFVFIKADIENKATLAKIFKKYSFGAGLNLAARAGVPYSLKNPTVYVTTNMLGTLNLLECWREFKIEKFILASTSSLYSDADMPFKESYACNTPLSPYAASKKGAEALCHSYHYLYGIDTIVLRYFTVYGPAGRPDMAPFRFIEWISREKSVLLNGSGAQSRDFTFVDDIARGTIQALKISGFEIINLGGSKDHRLLDLIQLIQKYTGKKAKLVHSKPLKVDALHTRADISKAGKLLSWKPAVSLEEGVRRTVKWHLDNRALTSKMRI